MIEISNFGSIDKLLISSLDFNFSVLLVFTLGRIFGFCSYVFDRSDVVLNNLLKLVFSHSKQSQSIDVKRLKSTQIE